MNILKSIKNFDRKIIKIMKIGLYFSYTFCIFASLILLTYNFYNEPHLFYTGISLLQSGLFFLVTFIICGFAFNKLFDELLCYYSRLLLYYLIILYYKS